MKKFKEYKSLDLVEIAAQTLRRWDEKNTFGRSLDEKQGHPEFVFYEGPPSANGMPGIHHMMARTIKDVFCRYKTQRGYLVNRKAGWDTHGLPVELGVEKKLGITKDDIGTKISIEDYNNACRAAVMEYTGVWEQMTRQMGYWVDMSDPYITYETKYIETLWWMLRQLYDKGLLYKGYTVQPYSPAAGTGLSNHELNQPGCYRDVKDTSVTAQFRVVDEDNLYFLAWTTTPWTLPSNTALAVGPTIVYVKISHNNPYTGTPQTVILAKERLDAYVKNLGEYTIAGELRGEDLVGLRYEQLLPWVTPDGDAFRVIAGDYVTTEDGTGIVHIAPTFGADDARVAAAAGIVPLFVVDKAGKNQPLVDKKGKFWEITELDADWVARSVNIAEYQPFAGKFVKPDYAPELTEEPLDVELAVLLKSAGKALKVEKYQHSYPHCWRTDKPVLYYPLDSWFIKTTAVKDELIALNETIHWRPASTGSGRFGKWLEGLVDWNLSRSRFWGTPLPIWATDDYSEMKCIGSVSELETEIEKSIAAGLMAESPYKGDLHRPYVDNIILVSCNGRPMRRETDLIDVWFDSGAMPFAQAHYPFEKENFRFPADFIAEGVDQTRGWFFTLHALATMLTGGVAFKNIISNGLVLDKNGNKMSKRLGNAVDPFEMMDKYGADAVRWYMMSNSQPWDNLRFDADGVDEVSRKFFGTLYNTYGFFALYANLDGFTGNETLVPLGKRPELDRWIISTLGTLVEQVTARLEDYDPTPAARAIADFVNNNLSNWYVRLNRKRFWAGSMTEDKLAAYQTLHTCLVTVCQLAAPFAPFIADELWCQLTVGDSVHLADWPAMSGEKIDRELEHRMKIAQDVSSIALALRRKVKLRVRQPLSRIIIPMLDQKTAHQIETMSEVIASEVNVKSVEIVTEPTGMITKRIKPDFKTLGKKYGAKMKQIAAEVGKFTQEDIAALELEGVTRLIIDDEELVLERADLEILSDDMPGWLVASEGALTVALDINITDDLKREGIARELVNRIQNMRKESGLEVTDTISVTLQAMPFIMQCLDSQMDYLAAQVLATKVVVADDPRGQFVQTVQIDEVELTIAITKSVK